MFREMDVLELTQWVKSSHKQLMGVTWSVVPKVPSRDTKILTRSYGDRLFASVTNMIIGTRKPLQSHLIVSVFVKNVVFDQKFTRNNNSENETLK